MNSVGCGDAAVLIEQLISALGLAVIAMAAVLQSPELVLFSGVRVEESGWVVLT